VPRLDASVTGEAHGDLRVPHLASAGWARVDPEGALDDLLLPSSSAGFVVARRPPAGVDLLGFKHALCPCNDNDDWNASSSDWASVFVELTDASRRVRNVQRGR
jgi:hypothetical protein